SLTGRGLRYAGGRSDMQGSRCAGAVNRSEPGTSLDHALSAAKEKGTLCAAPFPSLGFPDQIWLHFHARGVRQSSRFEKCLKGKHSALPGLGGSRDIFFLGFLTTGRPGSCGGGERATSQEPRTTGAPDRRPRTLRCVIREPRVRTNRASPT